MAVRTLEIALTLILTGIVGGIVLWATGAVRPEALLVETPQLILVGLWVGILVWAILLVVSALRSRARGRRLSRWNNVACAALAAAVNALVLTIIGFSMGGYSVLLSIVSVMAGVAFLAGAAIASLIVNRFVRPRNPQPGSPAAP